MAESRPALHFSRCKQVGTRHPLVMEMVSKQDIRIKSSGTDHMIADIFTKPLALNRFQSALERLNIFRIDQDKHYNCPVLRNS